VLLAVEHLPRFSYRCLNTRVTSLLPHLDWRVRTPGVRDVWSGSVGTLWAEEQQKAYAYNVGAFFPAGGRCQRTCHLPHQRKKVTTGFRLPKRYPLCFTGWQGDTSGL